MKDFIFVSDFDGTITDKDFDELLLENLLKDREGEFEKLWNKETTTISSYLKAVFGAVNCSEDELKNEILKLNIDKYLKGFIKFVKENNGDFMIVSSGSSYYINILLDYFEIIDIEVISNNAVFEDNNLNLIIDEKSTIYSKEFGINKKKVVEGLRGKAKKIYYSGDGTSDLDASLISDLVFAKGSLREALNKLNKENIGFNNFGEIQNYFIDNIVRNF
jgi:2,3-diketo-5-methylthio-1-phosphopentane phosphatase